MAADRAQYVALADMGARGTADIDLPFTVADGDGTHVLDHRLGAVARAARRGQLELAGAVEATEAPFDLGRQLHAVAEPEPAEVGADAALAGPVALAPGVAGRHVEVFPDRGQLVLRDADEVDALTAGELDQRDGVLLGDVGDPAQLGGRGDAAGHFRDHRERAVLLDVAVHPVVDETGVALVLVLALPDHGQQRGQGDLGGRVVLLGEGAEHGRNRLQALLLHRLDQLRLGHRDVRHVVVDRGVLLDLAAAEELDQLAHQPLAGAAAHAGPGRLHHGLGGALAGRDAGADRLLADAVAVADLGVAGISSSVTFSAGAPMSNSSDRRSSGSGVLRSKACIR